MDLEEKIELYCRIYEQVYQRISNLNLENADEVSLRIFMELSKNLREEPTAKRGSRERQISERSDEKLATKKQREAIHKFGVQKIPKDLSKKEASEILNELIGYSKENDREAIASFVQELNQRWNLSQ